MNSPQQELLRQIIEGTATETGTEFFDALVKNLAQSLDTAGSWVTEYLPESNRLRAFSFWYRDDYVADYEYDVVGTPCELVVRERKLMHFEENIIELFPGDNDLPEMDAVSFMGMPFLDANGRIVGHLAVLDDKPMPQDERFEAIFRIFAARAGAEVRRLKAEAKIREREARLNRVVSGAMDAIIEFDSSFKITHLNPAASEMFDAADEELEGKDFSTCLTDESLEKLKSLQGQFASESKGRKSIWVAGGLEVRCGETKAIQAEATLSSYESGQRDYYMLILRDVNERIEAERKIHSLTAETEYLREQLEKEVGLGEIIGRSSALLQVLHDVKQVADTDATVLISGETGTGKELIARAVHDASNRKDKALIKVNCAAIPTNLIESEFFGHEKGAFTGATAKREGRFALADGGSIFLDEVGELPLDLQSKLLRVLQEGEFEPVGSSRTQKVDVRVIAATNRNLKKEVDDGRFREDLYFRLNVFPIAVPPLRRRGDDVLLLADFFIKRVSQRMGRRIEPLSPRCKNRLLTYDWPGNIRELQNVIERAVITAKDGQLNLDRALPDPEPTQQPAAQPIENAESSGILTAGELQELERKNICQALEASNWKVSGKNGAATLLGINPSTLASRIRALKIRKPK